MPLLFASWTVFPKIAVSELSTRPFGTPEQIRQAGGDTEVGNQARGHVTHFQNPIFAQFGFLPKVSLNSILLLPSCN